MWCAFESGCITLDHLCIWKSHIYHDPPISQLEKVRPRKRAGFALGHSRPGVEQGPERDPDLLIPRTGPCLPTREHLSPLWVAVCVACSASHIVSECDGSHCGVVSECDRSFPKGRRAHVGKITQKDRHTPLMVIMAELLLTLCRALASVPSVPRPQTACE